MIFKAILEHLNGAIERGEIDTKYDNVMQAYIKDHRYILKQLPADSHLPHPENFYSELFSVATALVS